MQAVGSASKVRILKFWKYDWARGAGDGGEREDGRDDGRHFKSDGGHEQDDEPTTGENVGPILFRSFKDI